MTWYEKREGVTALGSTTPLHVAATYNRVGVAKLLLTRGADVSATDKWGGTPLQYASFNGHSDLVELYMVQGAKVNHRERRYGITALHAAVAGKNIRTVELLISGGADVNVKSHAGETPRGTALRMNQARFADLLRKHGARD